MKRVMVTVLAAMALVVLAGCMRASDPRYTLATAVDGYTATVNVLAEARQAGKIDDATAERIEEYRKLARSALASWDQAVESGQPTASAAREFNDAMRVLLEERLKAEAQTKEDGQ
jgi:uncharacterized protein YdbL (DUF1318 family)